MTGCPVQRSADSPTSTVRPALELSGEGTREQRLGGATPVDPQQPDSPDLLDRRTLLKGVGVAAAAAGLASELGAIPGAQGAPAVDPGDRTFIEGYTDRLSYRAGDTIGFHVSSDAPRFSIEVARLGDRREVVWAKQ